VQGKRVSFLTIKELSIVDTRTKTALVSDLSLSLERGETLALIGQSGSGKSLTCKAILGILPRWLRCEGSIVLEGKELLPTSPRRIGVVLQEAMNAFDPLFSVGAQMMESLRYRHDAKAHALEWLFKMGFEEEERFFQRYPHELSGGELQRVMMAIAFAQERALIIADEPTSALDALSQKEVMGLFEAYQSAHSALLFVSHDLALVSHLADRVAVMKAGKLVEENTVQALFEAPKEPYTRSLIQTRQALSQRFLACFA
jgi:nickel transport system ATP-binding protein